MTTATLVSELPPGKGLTIIHVHGSEDYVAMRIEDEFGVEEAYQLAKDGGGRAKIELDDEYDIAYVEVLEFGEVDPKFIDFVQSFIDYDHSKHENFFVVDTEGDD